MVDEDGNLTEDAKTAIEILEQYAKTFQERNPNLYLFNCVMHLDEATPHLHIDYIPVAHGYKNGMKTRNSLTKAFQQMGFAKAVSRKQNETVAWQETLDSQNEALEKHNDDLSQRTSELAAQAQEMEIYNNGLVLQAQELTEQIEKAEEKEKAAKEILSKHDLRVETFKTISKEVNAETKKMKSAAVPITSLFGGEKYVKVKKNDWNTMLDAFGKAISRNHLLEKYEKKIAGLEKRITTLTDQVEKLKRFVASRGLGEAFVEFVKSLEPKTMKQKLEDAKAYSAEQSRQRNAQRHELPEKGKQWQQEM